MSKILLILTPLLIITTTITFFNAYSEIPNY